MKKFLSVILSLSMAFGPCHTTFAENVGSSNSTTSTNSTSGGTDFKEDDTESSFWFNLSGMPFFDGAKKAFNETTSFLGKAINVIERCGNLGYKMNGIQYGFNTLYATWKFVKGHFENLKLKFSRINQNVDSVIEGLDKELSCIVGQDKAKKKMKEYVASIIDERNEAKENGRPYGKGDVIYMPGPSGVGKTFSAECLARAIMGPSAEPIRIDSSCFDKSSQTSLKSQILYMREKKNDSNEMSFFYVDNSLAGKIASNPKTVLIFDEYDKWGSSETDEFLRTIMDKGIIYKDGERINCSGLLVIVLSNEDHSSVTAGNGNAVFKDDGTGSRTHVVHDTSFLNRLNIVEFDNLYEDDYKKITENQLEEISKRYGKLYSVKFDFGEVATQIAAKVAKLNKGAREIAKILSGLRKTIISKRQKLQDDFAGKLFNVKFNPSNGNFLLKGENEDDELDEEDLEFASEQVDEVAPESETLEAEDVKVEDNSLAANEETKDEKIEDNGSGAYEGTNEFEQVDDSNKVEPEEHLERFFDMSQAKG